MNLSLVLLWICGACLRLGVLAVPPVIAMIQRDLALSGTEIGLLSGIPVVIFAIFATPGSSVVSRLGVRGALVGGLVVAAAGTLLRSGVSDAWQLYLASVIMSAGIAVMQPALASAVREWVPDRAAFGTAVYTNGLIMGEIIPVATMLALIVPAVGGGWRAALGVWAIPLIGAAMTVAMFAPRSSATPARTATVRWLPQLNSRLNWRIGLTLGSITSTYFCLNGFLPALLAEHGDGAIVSQTLTALNAGQLPASILLVLTADRLQGKRWAYLVLGALTCASVVGITMSAGTWTVIWAAVAGISFGASLPLGLALPPLLCDNPDDVAFTSAAAFAIAYGFAMLMSFLSGAAWDLARDIDAALVVVFFGSLPILFATPRLTAMRSPAAPTPPPSGKA